MNYLTLRSCFAATALCATAVVFGQTPSTTDRPQEPRAQDQERRSQDQDGQQSMAQIANAYRQLHQTTLNTLQEKARNWKEEKAGESTRGDVGATRDKDASSVAGTSTSLRGEELLIAACSKGLLAGAPSANRSSASRPSGSSGSGNTSGSGSSSGSGNPNADAPQNAEGRSDGSRGDQGEAQSVGMILVCVHSTSDTSRLSGTSDRRDAQTREAGSEEERAAQPASVSTSGRLSPGVYCVKKSGQSVWLTDRQGRIVLRTNIEHHGSGAASGDDRSQGRNDEPGRKLDPTASRAGSTAMEGNDQKEWEHVFGAITKEAMTSLGWAEKKGTSSNR